MAAIPWPGRVRLATSGCAMVAVLGLGALVPSLASARDGHNRHAEDTGYDAAREETFTGVVAQGGPPDESATHPGTTRAARLLLETAGDTVAVRLAPADFLDAIGARIHEGDTLVVVGSRPDGSDDIIARELRKGGSRWALRDAAGRPLWSASSTESQPFWTTRWFLLAALAAKVAVIVVLMNK